MEMNLFKIWMGLLLTASYFYVCSRVVLTSKNSQKDLVHKYLGKENGALTFQVLAIAFLALAVICFLVDLLHGVA